jgi:hypothetical protein
VVIDKLASTGIIVGASASAASATASADQSMIAIIAPVAVCCLAACFARFIVIFGPTSRKKKAWAYEVALVALCVLVSGALAYDHAWTVGAAAGYGGGIGFIGAGLKPILENLFKSFIASVAASVQGETKPSE